MTSHRPIHRFAAPRIVALALGLSVTCAGRLSAAQIAAGGGYDYYSGPGGQTTSSVLGIVAADLSGLASASLAALRYDDNLSGTGDGVAVALAVPARVATFKFNATRMIGDTSLRAWRVRTGPVFGARGGGSVGLYYIHYEDNTAPQAHSDGGMGELTFPVAAGLSGRLSAAVASLPGSLTSGEADAGLLWSPMHALELEGEVGVARNGSVTSGIGPARGPIGSVLGLLGGGPPQTTPTTSRTTTVDPTASLGLRVMLP